MKLFVLMCALFAFSIATPLTAGAFDPLENACEANSASPVCQNGGGDPVLGEQGIVLRAATIITNVTAIVAVIIIIIAGLTMTLSSGNSSQVQSSRDAIIYAAVALVIAGLGRAIIAFIVSNLT